MNKKYNVSMFDKIKDALKKSEKGTGGSYANIMKFPAGHTYTLRLIPDIVNIDDTFFHHYINSWSSKKDGSYVSAISLKSFGERDPINEVRWKLYKEWKDSGPSKDEKFENPIKEKELWLVKVLVVDDPANPENNGKVKVLNMGPQLKAIVDDAMVGDRADEFGPAIFDLSKDGVDFKVKAEEQGIYTTYIKSFFTTKTSLDLSDDEIDEIYVDGIDLKQIHTVRTFDDLQSMLDEHFFCGEETPKQEERKSLPRTTTKPTTDYPVVSDDVDDDIPMFHKNEKASDNEVEDLLADLDID